MAVFLFLLLLLSLSHAKVFISQWQDAVTPLMVDYVKRSLERAEKEGGTIFVLELNTPGGLESSMREVVQEFQRTPLPVVVYVYPPGGRAASAGAIITVSADVAVMAPGTNIGAATPVQMGGERMDEAMREKVMQDMLAFVRSIAKEKGRNPEVIERMVKEAISLTPEEALKEKVIDLIAVDRTDLLKKLEGRKINKHGKEITLKTEGIQTVEVGKSLREELLRVITNPTLAYMLLLIGFYGIFFELYNPGSIIPGAVGVICLLLGLYGLGVIGINWLGLLLILAGILLLVLELVTPTFGGLAIAGAIALALGSFILISPESPYGNIPISVIATMVGLTVAFFLFAGRLGLKAQKRKKMLGTEGSEEKEDAGHRRAGG
ncbi:MAG: NfeD family protein, partial [Aquificaceae bacterium]